MQEEEKSSVRGLRGREKRVFQKNSGMRLVPLKDPGDSEIKREPGETAEGSSEWEPIKLGKTTFLIIGNILTINKLIKDHTKACRLSNSCGAHTPLRVECKGRGEREPMLLPGLVWKEGKEGQGLSLRLNYPVTLEGGSSPHHPRAMRYFSHIKNFSGLPNLASIHFS